MRKFLGDLLTFPGNRLHQFLATFNSKVPTEPATVFLKHKFSVQFFLTSLVYVHIN